MKVARPGHHRVPHEAEASPVIQHSLSEVRTRSHHRNNSRDGRQLRGCRRPPPRRQNARGGGEATRTTKVAGPPADDWTTVTYKEARPLQQELRAEAWEHPIPMEDDGKLNLRTDQAVRKATPLH